MGRTGRDELWQKWWLSGHGKVKIGQFEYEMGLLMRFLFFREFPLILYIEIILYFSPLFFIEGTDGRVFVKI